MAFVPHVLCANCQRSFASDADLTTVVVCPHCQHEGTPERIMQVTGFPSLEVFTRNWQQAKQSSQIQKTGSAPTEPEETSNT